MKEHINKTNSRSNTLGTVKTVEKREDGKLHDHQGKSYKLPIHDTAIERRNFPGAKEYNLIKAEDFFCGGDIAGPTYCHEKQPRKRRGGI